MSVSQKFISDCSHRLHSALSKFEVEGMWPKKRREFNLMHPDDFGKELTAHYDAAYAKFHEETSLECLDVLVQMCRAYGVRFFSITQLDFICLEGIKVDRYKNSWPVNVSWVIADGLDMHHKEHPHRIHSQWSSGTGNGPQRQVGFMRCMADGSSGDPALRESEWGVYDLRNGVTRVCNGINLFAPRHLEAPKNVTMSFDYANDPYEDGTDLLEYLVQAGAYIPGYRREKVNGDSKRRFRYKAVRDRHPAALSEVI